MLQLYSENNSITSPSEYQSKPHSFWESIWAYNNKCNYNPVRHYRCKGKWCPRHGCSQRRELANAVLETKDANKWWWYYELNTNAYLKPEQLTRIRKKFLYELRSILPVEDYIWTLEFKYFRPHLNMLFSIGRSDDHYIICLNGKRIGKNDDKLIMESIENVVKQCWTNALQSNAIALPSKRRISCKEVYDFAGIVHYIFKTRCQYKTYECPPRVKVHGIRFKWNYTNFRNATSSQLKRTILYKLDAERNPDLEGYSSGWVGRLVLQPTPDRRSETT